MFTYIYLGYTAYVTYNFIKPFFYLVKPTIYLVKPTMYLVKTIFYKKDQITDDWELINL